MKLPPQGAPFAFLIVFASTPWPPSTKQSSTVHLAELAAPHRLPEPYPPIKTSSVVYLNNDGKSGSLLSIYFLVFLSLQREIVFRLFIKGSVYYFFSCRCFHGRLFPVCLSVEFSPFLPLYIHCFSMGRRPFLWCKNNQAGQAKEIKAGFS
jgi:hypothetical protein